MLKKILEKLVRWSVKKMARTKGGQELLITALYDFPLISIESFGRRSSIEMGFDKVADFPPSIHGFEDLYFLFCCSPLNMGICALSLDEAAYLYKLVKTLRQATLVEIGRFKGGGTFILASAMPADATLLSYDLHVKMPRYFNGKILDDYCLKVLKRYNLDKRVKILVGDSTKIETSQLSVDFIFFDGDHSYQGIKSDFQNWFPAAKKGGHLLFHDAARPRPYTTCHEGVLQLIQELEQRYSNELIKVKEIGSIVHFIKK